MKSRFPALVMISAAVLVAPIHVIGQAQVSKMEAGRQKARRSRTRGGLRPVCQTAGRI